MTTRLVVDASALVALLVDPGREGGWVRETLASAELAAPSLLGFECANVLRRLELSGRLTTGQASAALASVVDLQIESWPPEILLPRIWELRPSLTAYDAAYVAVAERTSAALVTLDRRLARSNGSRCPFLLPPQSGPGGA